jgi:hypothetical protein
MIRSVRASLRCSIALLVCLGIFNFASVGSASAVPLPLANDIAPPSKAAELQKGGFSRMGAYLDLHSYTLRLVANGQGNVESLRSTVQTAANEISSANGTAITVAPGTVADTVPDREPGYGELLLSIDSTTPCASGQAGCGGVRSYQSPSTAASGRVWIDPAVLGYTTAEKQHVIDHLLGHALNLGHYEGSYEGAPQVMSPTSYSASGYRGGDRNGLSYLNFSPQDFIGFVGSSSKFSSIRNNTSDPFNSSFSVAPGTSVAVDSTPFDGDFAAFQAAGTNDLQIYSSATGTTTDTNLAMKSGTSPDIAVEPGIGGASYVASFETSTGTLGVYSSKTGYTNTGLGMAAGTSPSIADNFYGSWVAAFQSNVGQLWFYSPAGTFVNTQLWMAPGTSPDVEVESGNFVGAFHSALGTLWAYSSVSGGTPINTGLGMKAGTSPSIDGHFYSSWVAAFQSNVGQLWFYTAAGSSLNTQLEMEPGSSPSAVVTSSGTNFKAAFQASSGVLGTYTSESGGSFNLSTLTMNAGTSPGMATIR